MSEIEAKLKQATGYEREAGSSRQEYLSGMARAVQQLSDEQWHKLPEPVQKWANTATDCLAAGEAIPDFNKPNGKPPDEPRKTKKAKKVAKPEKRPPKKAKKVAKAQRPEGAQSMIKRLVLKKPRISTDEVLEQLTKKGYKATKFAVSTIRSGMRHTLKIIQEEGIDVLKLEL